MNLDDVVVFVTVDEHSSFSAAARRLGLSRVGVSRSISRLEASLGTQLLIRTSRHVWLTSEGREFRDKVKESITSLTGAVRQFSDRDLKPTGRLRIGVMAEVAGLGLASTIASFAEENPTVRIELRQTSALHGAQLDAFDLVLGFPGEAERAELRGSSSRYVGAAVCQLFAAPSYLTKNGAPQELGDLVRHTQVTTVVSTLEKASAVNRVRSAGSTHGIECGDMFLARELVRLGCGLGLLPRAFVEQDVANGTLVPVLAEWSEAQLHLWLVVSPGPHGSALTTAFCEFFISDLRRRQLVAV
jgi:DNA-binding transcriptional LysR family regulator